MHAAAGVLQRMHEMSLALELGRQVEEQMRLHPGRLLRVGVQVGEESGVEPSSLEFCIDAVLAHPPFAGATVTLERVGGDTLRLEFLEIDDGRPDN